MDRRALLPVGVVCLVLLSGCAGIGLSNDGGSEPGTTTTTTAEPTTTTTAEPTTTTANETTTTTAEPWAAPPRPNTPFQNNLDEVAGNRIQSADIVAGNGSSQFTLEVAANTSMPSVDPAEHGSVRGEPFLLGYANATIENTSNGVKVNGTLIERSEILAQEENGTFTITIREGGLEAADVEEGETKLLVLLMDRDKDWDDIYGIRRVTIEYVPSGE